MKPQHTYKTNLNWTGNNGEGTESYKTYERSYTISIDNKPDILGSSDPSFRGDATKYNPEELLVASLSSCHMLWYLHLCSEADIIVTHYEDNATGTMVEIANGAGHFTEVTLHPKVTVSEVLMIDNANALHTKANALCFIANSVNFKVKHHPTCVVE